MEARFYCVQDIKLIEEKHKKIREIEPLENLRFIPVNFLDKTLRFGFTRNHWTFFSLNNTLKTPDSLIIL